MSLKNQNPETITRDDGQQQDELELIGVSAAAQVPKKSSKNKSILIHEEPKHALELMAEDLSRGFQQSPITQINRVPKATTSEDHEKYYFPKVVSIGPYHYGQEHLTHVQNHKLDFAKDLFSTLERGKLQDLLAKLGEPDMLNKLRCYYEENSTDHFSDAAFTGMMLLDGCFILYYILLIGGRHFETKRKLSHHQMTSIRQDLFLLENQIPFTVVMVVMNHMKEDCENIVKRFIVESTFSSRLAGKTGPGLFWASNSYTEISSLTLKNEDVNHLLHLLRLNLTKKCNDTTSSSDAHVDGTFHQHHLPTVKELMDAGIIFKKSSTMSLCQIDFSNHWWRVSATVRLPPILVEEASTKYLFLNLMAYESSSHKPNDLWVTSYIWLLNSLISKPEDVKALRDAEVFVDSQGSDDEVKKVIKDMAAGIVPDNLAYTDTKVRIQEYYEGLKSFNTPISQLKDKYFNSPWSVLALAGAILALFLTAVQTYFTVWSLKGECDDLCRFLKLNHHL